ncbi:hypothetical protein F7734_32190 [Scytonema sp. UIC 10036]|uniref:hypothetical protein n=1 Tax=Scytonema sp. UIC 10036 TaxID=2304196 RepID=UPI0012DACB28|nr:hypothetical protein [Scytonema sp. UIC 10036]MUG96750.1 hypothetical protein [Scytonema sp. UIC 10036]
MYLPIVVLHRGYSAYVPYCLAQAKVFNPKSDIVLLGDDKNSFINYIHHERIENYDDEAKEFEKVYSEKHMSFNNYQYELFCFQRWFVIKNFLEKNQLDKCLHLDSDVMIYVDASEEFSKKYEKFNFTLSKKGSGHNSYIKYEGIKKLCELLTKFYTDPELFKILKSIREKALLAGQKAGGICDMTLLNQYYQRYSQEIGLTSDMIDGSVYDANINSSDGFEMHEGMKKIYWKNGFVYCKYLDSDKEVKFNSLHFQGHAKRHMKDYFTGNKQQIFFSLLKYKAIATYNQYAKK